MRFRLRCAEFDAFPGYFSTRFGHWISYTLAQRRAKTLAPADLPRAYDSALAAFEVQLSKLHADEWALATRLPPPGRMRLSVQNYVSIEMPAHLALHRKEITDTLTARQQGAV